MSTHPEIEDGDHWVAICEVLSKDDDIAETAQHMRLTECWLPGYVWTRVNIEGL